jgi:hypothetical protein
MTKSDTDFNRFLKGKNHAVLLREIIKMYTNDKNSSFLREMITCSVAGYNHSANKHGYDGKFEEIHCEVKSQNIISDGNKRLCGHGNFTDFTWRRFNKYYKDKVRMLISGFVDGKLIFVLEFPFRSKKFQICLLEKLQKHLPHGDEKNKYVRNCRWSLLHVDNVNIRYLTKNFRNYKNKLTKKLFDFLESSEKKLYVGPINK